MAITRFSDLTVTPVTADAATTARFYAGFNFRNTTGASIVVAIYDGTSTGGILIETVNIPANDSRSELYAREIPLTSGSFYVDWTTGIVGSVRAIV